MGKVYGWFAALALVIAGGTSYMVMTGSAVAQDDDGRTAIILTAAERNMVLGEMREFLVSVKLITQGVVNKDMKAIQAAGRRMGMAAASGVPSSLADKLPDSFKKLAGATHKGFDAMATEAEDIGDEKAILVKLGNLLNNCTTCHSSYRFEVEAGGK